MDGLIDSLNTDVWQEVTNDKKSSGYQEYQVNRNHNRKDATTLAIMITDDSGDAKTVIVADALPDKDPLKNIGCCEILLGGDNQVAGIDLNGDIVQRKS